MSLKRILFVEASGSITELENAVNEKITRIERAGAYTVIDVKHSDDRTCMLLLEEVE